MCVKEYQFTSGNRGIFSDSEYLFDNYVLRYKSVEKMPKLFNNEKIFCCQFKFILFICSL